MQLIFVTHVVVLGKPLLNYRILEVDTGTWFADPKDEDWKGVHDKPPEFYISKVNGKWKAEPEAGTTYIVPSIIEDISKDIEQYLNGRL